MLGENHIEVAHAGWLDQPLGDRPYRLRNVCNFLVLNYS